jgi:hypothetical protein
MPRAPARGAGNARRGVALPRLCGRVEHDDRGLTLNAGFKSGTISLSMSPAVGQHGATHTIVGSWSC